MKKLFRILGNVGIADDNDVFSSAEQSLGKDQHSDRLCKWLSIRPGFVSSGVVDMSTISIMYTTETTTMMIILGLGCESCAEVGDPAKGR